MYKIGEFSKMASLSIKALRYYDDVGLLTPAHRDEENGYRLYDEGNFDQALLIKQLRGLEFSILEIKDALSLCDSQGDLNYIFNEKRELIQKEIETKNELIKKISASVILIPKEEVKMNYEITVKEIPEIKVASIRYKGRYEDCGDYAGKLYKKLKGNSKGSFFNMYYQVEYAEQADIEVCIPVKKDINIDITTIKILPKIKALSATHVGRYDNLGYGYKAIIDYAKENDIQITVPIREIYIKGPGMIFRGNPDKYITEIIVPISEQKELVK